MKYLFFDTETTGLPLNWNAPSSDTDNWPRLVQLSWYVTDDHANIKKQEDCYIYPDGFEIPEESSSVHGITTEFAKEHGQPLVDVMMRFVADMNSVDVIIGHNIDFDKKIVGAEMIRLGGRDIAQTKPSWCTMKSTVYLCNIPGKYGPKWPTLQELHTRLFGVPFEDAHNSQSDITATMKCFWELAQNYQGNPDVKWQ